MSATRTGPTAPPSGAEVSDRDVGDTLIREGRRDPLSEGRQRLAGEAKERVKSAAEQGKGRAASLLSDVSDALDAFTSTLHERGHDRTADYAEKVVGSLRRASDDLPNRNLGDLLSKVEDFARERPVTFVSALFAAGFVGARFLRASAPDPTTDYQGGDFERAGYDVYRSEPAGTGSDYHAG